MRLAALLLALSLAACERTHAREAALSEDDEQQIVVRRAQAFVISPNRVVPADELAAAVRSSGYPCEGVTSLGQLELNGKGLDNYKLDCRDRSYLVTWLDGDSRIKPWTRATLESSLPSRRSPP
jgi:hypothetical protein